MAYSESYLNGVLERLRPVVSVRYRKMFGGIGIYGDELFFAIIADDVLYFKVDDSNRGDYEAAGMGSFGNMPYYQVPDHVLDDPDTLQDWIEKSVAVAASARKSKKS